MPLVSPPQVVVTAVSVVLMDLAGRRPLMLTAALGMAVSAIALGIALKQQQGMVAVRASAARVCCALCRKHAWHTRRERPARTDLTLCVALGRFSR